MRIYFLSCVPAILKLNGLYAGGVDLFERQIDVDLNDNILAEVVPGENLQPANFFLDGKILTSPPDFMDVYLLEGDALVYSIGAASILAKVHRDALMAKYAEEFPEYGFEKNAGYGTAAHIAAIREVGICKIHRKTFVTKFWDGRVRP